MLTALGPPPAPSGGIRAFVKVRNESPRLRHFLDHHRTLGVERFFVVDNASSDGTAAYLLAQPDVSLFTTAQSFREAQGGQAWLNRLLDDFGRGHWCLTLDADELLVFPGMEAMPLAALCRALRDEGADGYRCMLIDMYGQEGVGRSEYRAGQPFLAACPWFDAGPYWRPGSRDPDAQPEIYGGIRQRLFFPAWEAGKASRSARERLYNGIDRIPRLRHSRAVQRWRAKRPPNLAKVPLAYWRDGLAYTATAHKLPGARLSAGSGALLHFKFLGEFAAKAAAEAGRGEYFDGAREYRTYAAALESGRRLDSLHACSTRYRDCAQLEELGLVRRGPREPPAAAAA